MRFRVRTAEGELADLAVRLTRCGRRRGALGRERHAPPLGDLALADHEGRGGELTRPLAAAAARAVREDEGRGDEAARRERLHEASTTRQRRVERTDLRACAEPDQ